MKLTEIAIKESRLTVALVLFLIIGGLIAFLRLPRSEDPQIPFRYAFITTIYPGASAERIESLISTKLEEALHEVPEVEFVNSLSRSNASGILVKLGDRYDNLRPIWENIRRKIERVKSDMPEGVQGPYLNDEYGEVFGIIVTVAGENASYEKLKSAADAVRQDLLRLEEVAKVIHLGDRQEQIVVFYDDAEMAKAGLSPSHVKSYLEAQNVIAPGGSIRQGEGRVAVEPDADLKSVRDIEDLQVSIPGDDVYSLYELVDIERQTREPPDSIVRSSGLPAVGLAVSMREGGNMEKLGDEVRGLIESYRDGNSIPGLEVDLVAFEPQRVKERVNRFFFNLLQSLVIVGFILMVTLGLRTGSVVSAMMPLVVLASLMVMLALGLNINLVALAAFVVVLGIMVDNHIVVSERILTHREHGMPSLKAAVTSTSELYAPLITATITTIAGFIPIYLANSTSGEYVTPLFNIVAISLICSTFLAFTVTPALSVKLFKSEPGADRARLQTPLYRFYRRLLLALLPRPILVMAGLVAAFAFSIYCFRFIPTIFFPPSDRPIFTLEIEFPAGAEIEQTEAAVAKIDSYIKNNLLEDSLGEKGITNWVSFIGRNAPRYILNHRTREYSPEYAYAIININSTDYFPLLRDKLEAFCTENFPGKQARIRRIEAGPATGYPIRVHVSGEDINGIFAIAEEVKNKAREIPGVYNVNDDWGAPVKKFTLTVDEEAAGEAAVTHGEAVLALQAYLTGIPATEIKEGGKSIPVFVQSTAEGDDEIEKIKNLHVHSSITGKTVPLRSVAEISEVSEFGTIIRRDFMRTVTVQADVKPGVNANKVDKVIGAFLDENKEKWGQEFNVRLGGEGTESARANLSIISNLPWAFFIIILLLINQTRSFRRTFIIVSALPMGIIGVVFGLIVTDVPFGFTTLVGIVSLTGIVANNAIILIDRIRINECSGDITMQECVVEAALNRLRPILLTTITTIGGILPLYLRGNPTWQGMSVALIFGLMFSTILVLLIVPVFYCLLFRISFKTCQENNPELHT